MINRQLVVGGMGDPETTPPLENQHVSPWEEREPPRLMVPVSWPGPLGHVSAIRTRGSEEQTVEYSLESTDDRNCSFTLPGREQTNNRAELFAAVAAMQVHDGNLEIRSDSAYAVRIATSRTRGETQKRKEGSTDLWDEVGDRAETQSHKAS